MPPLIQIEPMRPIAAIIALVLGLLALLAPAIWNGFPITFHDTGGYMSRLFDDEPANGRATPYGVVLEWLHLGLEYWPVIALQSLLVLSLVAEAGRSLLGLRGSALGLFTGLATIVLALVTAISWYSAQLLPDILAPAAVLALFLLIEGRKTRGLAGQLGLTLVIAFGASSHTGTVALVLGLVLGTALVALALRPVKSARGWSGQTFRRLGLGALALAIGVVAVPLSNLALYNQFRFTPGGDVFLFGRLVQDGIASRYLADHCPDPTIKLCDYQKEMYEDDGSLRSNDSFLWWGGSPLYKIGGWDGAGPELSRITMASLRDYPLMHLKAAWRSFVQQLGEIATGDGLNDDHWHTRWTFEQYHPEDLDAFNKARQRAGAIPFETFDIPHITAGFIAIGLLPVIAFVGWRRGEGGTARLAAFVFVALIGNAAICGILSNPHDRYQSRLVWLAALTCVVAGTALARGKMTNSQ